MYQGTVGYARRELGKRMRLKFDARARAILRRLPVVNVYSAVELALLAGLALQCARLTWVILTPVSPLGAWTPAGPAIPVDPAGVLGGFDPFYRVSGAVAKGPSVVTSLQVTLFGTRIDTAQGRGSAIIAGPDGVQKSISVGEEVAPGVTLKSVAFDHVTLDRGGVTEDLFLDQSSGTTTGTPPPGVPSAAMPAATPGVAPSASMNPLAAGIQVEQLRSEIQAIPRVDGGRISGLTVRGGNGLAFRTAGLRDGDVITAVGGRPIAGPSDLERMGRDGVRGGALALTVERDGRSVPLNVKVSQ
jgi:general secretion pathway protein C